MIKIDMKIEKYISCHINFLSTKKCRVFIREAFK